VTLDASPRSSGSRDRDRYSRSIARNDARIPAVVIGASIPAVAQAHFNSSGLGPVYDGALHFFASPEDCAAVVALALLAGLRGAAHGRRVLFVLPFAWLLGSVLGLAAVMTQASPALSASWLLALGVLVALDARLSPTVITALAALLGLVHGYSNGSGMDMTRPVLIALVGLSATVFVAVALPAAAVIRFGDAWRQIAVRVAGSWIAASGLLLLGWALRG
jgi:hydrogenase/urease accessory protein HupE